MLGILLLALFVSCCVTGLLVGVALAPLLVFGLVLVPLSLWHPVDDANSFTLSIFYVPGRFNAYHHLSSSKFLPFLTAAQIVLCVRVSRIIWHGNRWRKAMMLAWIVIGLFARQHWIRVLVVSAGVQQQKTAVT